MLLIYFLYQPFNLILQYVTPASYNSATEPNKAIVLGSVGDPKCRTVKSLSRPGEAVRMLSRGVRASFTLGSLNT